MLSSFPGLIWPSGVRIGCGFLGLESLTGYIMSLFSARPWTGCLFGPVALKRVWRLAMSGLNVWYSQTRLLRTLRGA